MSENKEQHKKSIRFFKTVKWLYGTRNRKKDSTRYYLRRVVKNLE